MNELEMILSRRAPWVPEMQQYLGRAEIPGPRTAPFIANWLRRLHTPWTDDETPWCGVAMAGVMEALGLPYPRMYYRARKWVGYGRPIATGKAEVARMARSIPYGAICVLDRPPSPSDGHVGIYCGLRQPTGAASTISLLAGNQGNAVTYASFPLYRVLYVGWPAEATLTANARHILIATALGLTVMPPASGGEA